MRLLAALAVAAAPLFVLGAAVPAEAKHCKCDKPGHHAKASHKKQKSYAHKSRSKSYHAKSHHSGYGDGLNTYGWQGQYGHSYGPGYGYVGEPNREGSYVRQYSAVDVHTSHYDSGWRETGTGAPVPPPYGHGVSGYSHQHDSGWVRPGGAGPCPHPGAVMCLPPGHSPVGQGAYGHGAHHGHSTYSNHGAHHHHSYHHGYGANEVKVQPEVFYGGLAGGVSGPESYGGFPTGGGAVVLGPTVGGSAFSSARADAFASAYARSKASGGYKYKKPRH